MRNAYNEPVCPKHLQRLLENIVPYYSQNIWLKCILYTSCLNLSSVGIRLKKSMQQVLALRQNRFFLNICDYFKKYVKSTEIQLHISSLQ